MATSRYDVSSDVLFVEEENLFHPLVGTIELVTIGAGSPFYKIEIEGVEYHIREEYVFGDVNEFADFIKNEVENLIHLAGDILKEYERYDPKEDDE